LRTQPVEILRSLKQYIKVVQKDRLHTVDRYDHLRDTDPAEAEALLPQMAEHLRTIDQQMNMALDHLNRVPKHQKKVQLQISK
jgi:E2 domain of amyloid precursor protein